MSRFYYVRHCETDHHARGILCGGDLDIPLNAAGAAQARKLAEVVRQSAADVKRVVSSPMLRARQTAEAMGLPVQLEETLREWRLGSLEGTPSAHSREVFDFVIDPPGGETRDELRARVQDFLMQIPSMPGPVLVVGHGAFAVMMFEELGIFQMPPRWGVLYQIAMDATGDWTVQELASIG